MAGCPAGGVVLDPFAGGGTTGLVADRMGFDAILIELNPDYADMARKRIVKLLRQPNFDEHFIEGIEDPAKAEKALRDFHKLLVAGGLA